MYDVSLGMYPIKKINIGIEIPYPTAYRTMLDANVSWGSIVDFILMPLNLSLLMCIVKDPIPRPKKAIDIAMNA